MEKIGFLGGGNMAEALINGLIAANIYPPQAILVSDVRPERLRLLAEKYAVKTAETNAQLAAAVDTLVLSVKPQNMPEALQSITDAFRNETLVISIAAGVKVADISDVLGDAAIVRVMPNTPALIGQGASALFANAKAKPLLTRAQRIFTAVGSAVVVENESLIDAVTAVSGSGPAYYFLLTEEIIKAAVQLGLSQKVAKDLVLQTAKGAALLAAEADKRGESPAQLRKKVTSSGGTTEAALTVFQDNNFADIVAKAVKRANQRSKELSGST